MGSAPPEAQHGEWCRERARCLPGCAPGTCTVLGACGRGPDSVCLATLCAGAACMGGAGSLEPPGSEAAAVDMGSLGGSGHREWGRQAALLQSGTRGLVDSRRGARPPGRVFPGAARPQTLVLTHLGCRWGRMGLTQPRMCTRRGENRMWCAEMGRKFLGAPWAPRPWDMVGAGGSTPQQSPVTAAGSTLGSSPWSA